MRSQIDYRFGNTFSIFEICNSSNSEDFTSQAQNESVCDDALAARPCCTRFLMTAHEGIQYKPNGGAIVARWQHRSRMIRCFVFIFGDRFFRNKMRHFSSGTMLPSFGGWLPFYLQVWDWEQSILEPITYCHQLIVMVLKGLRSYKLANSEVNSKCANSEIMKYLLSITSFLPLTIVVESAEWILIDPLTQAVTSLPWKWITLCVPIQFSFCKNQSSTFYRWGQPHL